LCPPNRVIVIVVMFSSRTANDPIKNTIKLRYDVYYITTYKSRPHNTNKRQLQLMYYIIQGYGGFLQKLIFSPFDKCSFYVFLLLL